MMSERRQTGAKTSHETPIGVYLLYIKHWWSDYPQGGPERGGAMFIISAIKHHGVNALFRDLDSELEETSRSNPIVPREYHPLKEPWEEYWAREKKEWGELNRFVLDAIRHWRFEVALGRLNPSLDYLREAGKA